MNPEQEEMLKEVHDDVKYLLQLVPTFATWDKLGKISATLVIIAVSVVAIVMA